MIWPLQKVNTTKVYDPTMLHGLKDSNKSLCFKREETLQLNKNNRKCLLAVISTLNVNKLKFSNVFRQVSIGFLHLSAKSAFSENKLIVIIHE